MLSVESWEKLEEQTCLLIQRFAIAQFVLDASQKQLLSEPIVIDLRKKYSQSVWHHSILWHIFGD